MQNQVCTSSLAQSFCVKMSLHSSWCRIVLTCSSGVTRRNASSMRVRTCRVEAAITLTRSSALLGIQDRDGVAAVAGQAGHPGVGAWSRARANTAPFQGGAPGPLRTAHQALPHLPEGASWRYKQSAHYVVIVKTHLWSRCRSGQTSVRLWSRCSRSGQNSVATRSCPCTLPAVTWRVRTGSVQLQVGTCGGGSPQRRGGGGVPRSCPQPADRVPVAAAGGAGSGCSRAGFCMALRQQVGAQVRLCAVRSPGKGVDSCGSTASQRPVEHTSIATGALGIVSSARQAQQCDGVAVGGFAASDVGSTSGRSLHK